VEIRLRLARQVEVDDVRDAFDVEPALGDVRRDERLQFAAAEPCERLLAVRLRALGGSAAALPP
jgi:hypothetical protein